MNRLLALYSNRKTFFRGSGILAFTAIASYALGLLRDRLLAQQFGASATFDAYNAAFLIPDLLLNIFVAGALSAAFIPIFSDIETGDNDHERSQFVNSVLNGSLLAVIVFGIIAFILAPFIARVAVPGFDPAAQQSYVQLMRILLLSPIIFAISNTLGSILIGRERFFWYGISAALYNAGIILGVLFLAPRWGITGVAIGTIGGALFHLAPRLMAFRSHVFRYRPHIAFDMYYRRFIRLMLPKMAGHPVEQVTFFGYTLIASMLGAGSIVVLNLARNFQSMPVAVIGVNAALAIFPALARASSSRDAKQFSHDVRSVSLMTFVLTSLAALVLYLIRYPLIDILIGGGQFDADAIARTAQTLGVFVLAIPTESTSHVLARAFYALKNSITPVMISIAALCVAIGTGYLFSRSMGVPGLALGFFAGSLVKIILLSVLLKFEIKKKL